MSDILFMVLQTKAWETPKLMVFLHKLEYCLDSSDILIFSILERNHHFFKSSLQIGGVYPLELPGYPPVVFLTSSTIVEGTISFSALALHLLI